MPAARIYRICRIWMLVVALAPAVARGGNNSIVTAAFGSQSVVSHTASQSGGAATEGGQGLNVRVRALYVLGAEVSYDLTSEGKGVKNNVPAPAFQWSMLLYIVPTKYFSLYLLGGIGATNNGDAFSITGSTSSYHGGAGIEVGVTKNWVLGADYRVSLPAYNQVMARDPSLLMTTPSADSLSRYYNFDTWQLNVGMRYYL